jgi:hypothetical protein
LSTYFVGNDNNKKEKKIILMDINKTIISLLRHKQKPAFIVWCMKKKET